jgi:hypothetical protein
VVGNFIGQTGNHIVDHGVHLLLGRLGVCTHQVGNLGRSGVVGHSSNAKSGSVCHKSDKVVDNGFVRGTWGGLGSGNAYVGRHVHHGVVGIDSRGGRAILVCDWHQVVRCRGRRVAVGLDVESGDHLAVVG